MAKSNEFEFSLDLEDCLKDNMPMLCLEIPQTYEGFMIERDTLWPLCVFLRVFANESNIDRKNFGTSTPSMG